MRMRKSVTGIMVLLAAACTVNAQQTRSTVSTADGTESVAAPFTDTSAARVNLLSANQGAAGSRSFVLATPADSTETASASAFPAEPPSTPTPKLVFGPRDDYRWQVGVGLEIFRFQSSIINATAVGLNTTVTYFTNDWFAVEGNLVTAFAPTIYQNEHVKYFGGGGGIRVGSRKDRWEPWGHALVGGGHLQPQTAGYSKSALMVQAGIGVDYRLYARISLRGEGDWVYTDFFNSTQNNFQGVAAVVFHF